MHKHMWVYNNVTVTNAQAHIVSILVTVCMQLFYEVVNW